jgi:N-dimethylarginine dimethylaminohydrolase
MTVWTEWDKLTEVIVGDTTTNFKTDDPKINSYLAQILEETKEDFDNLSTFLQSGNIKVHRPTINSSVQNTMPPMIPRDQYLVYGDVIYSTFTSMKERYYDQYYYYDIFKNLFETGYNWIQQPIPDIPKLSVSEAWINKGREIYQDRYKDKLLLHTATATKIGDSLIMNTAGPGTHLGQQWLKRNLPADTRIIDNINTASNGWGHIDQCWFMTSDDTVICLSKDWVPVCLRNKRIIEIKDYVSFPDLSQYVTDMKNCGGKFTESWLEKWFSEWRGYAQEVCFDTNVLVLDHNKILLSNPQPKLEKYLETQGIECYSTRLRHGLFWESGVHCCTLDIDRIGQKRNIL